MATHTEAAVSYWGTPAEELRDVLVEIGLAPAHIGSEFVEALLEQEVAADDKREFPEPLSEED